MRELPEGDPAAVVVPTVDKRVSMISRRAPDPFQLGRLGPLPDLGRGGIAS